jgi:hypothetical protein
MPRQTIIGQPEQSSQWPWILTLLCAFAFMGWAIWFGHTKDAEKHDEKNRFMGQCVVVKEQPAQRCEELWRWRLDRDK